MFRQSLLGVAQHVSAVAWAKRARVRHIGRLLSVALISMSSSRLALAQAPDVPPLAASTTHELMALEWDGLGAPKGCLSSDSLAAKVEEFLGRAAFDPASPQVNGPFRA